MRSKSLIISISIVLISGCSSVNSNGNQLVSENSGFHEKCRIEALELLKSERKRVPATVSDKELRIRSEVRYLSDCHKSEIYRLYRLAKRRNHDVEGEVTLSLEVSKDGTVGKVTIDESDIDDIKLLNDLVNLYAKFKFNQATDDFNTSFKMSFLGSVNTNLIDSVAPEKAPIKARGVKFGDSK